MIVSHSAARELNGAESVNPEAFYSFFSDLKQWAREETREFIVRDLKGKDYDLQSYLTMPSVQEGGIDPIEIYAYYLGLYINNMDDGIYMKYLWNRGRYNVVWEKMQIPYEIIVSLLL